MVTVTDHFFRGLAVAALIVGSICGCAATNQVSTRDAVLAQLPREVRAAWTKHYDYLVRIVKGGQFDGAQFTSALEFFEAVTGVEAHDNKSYVGRLPTDSL